MAEKKQAEHDHHWEDPNHYRCSSCQQVKPRDELVVKRVQYVTMGKSPKVLRSRVVGWLCQHCVEQQAEWNRPIHSASPGLAPFLDNQEGGKTA